MREAQNAKLLSIESIDLLVNLGRNPKYEKSLPVLMNTLKMIARVPEMDKRIK